MSYAFIKSHFLSGEQLVYHHADWTGEHAGADPDGVWRARTDCGIVRHDDSGAGLKGTYLSFGLAERIARPCLNCFRHAATDDAGVWHRYVAS